jgi:multicomponent K+:H+ antiporter subunit E
MKTFFLLLAFWLVLNESVAPGHVLLGSGIAGLVVFALRRERAGTGVVRRPMAGLRLFLVVAMDVLHSNVAVGRIVLGLGRANRTAGFVPVPLALRAPAGLAALACIVTATPGTSWVRYDRAESVLTLHVLDVTDPDALAAQIKRRYEKPLMEIFE